LRAQLPPSRFDIHALGPAVLHKRIAAELARGTRTCRRSSGASTTRSPADAHALAECTAMLFEANGTYQFLPQNYERERT
jgi:hypothetical protein